MNALVLNNNGKLVTSSRLVAEKFGKLHKNVIQSIEKLECSEEFTGLNFQLSEYTDPTGRKLPEYIITKDGFSFLVMGFTGKGAAKFKEEFIAAFNKMEEVIKQVTPPTDDQVLAQAMSILNNRLEEFNMKLIGANNTILEQAPKVAYVNKVLDAPDLIPTTIIAKELGMSAMALNHSLHQKEVQYRQGNTWVLYSKYQDKGYTKTKTHTYHDQEGVLHTSIHTFWTERGRAFIHYLLGNLKNVMTN